MSYVLVCLGAIKRDGSDVPSQFLAWADDHSLAPRGATTDGRPIFEIPDETAEVRLEVTPTDKDYWFNRVYLEVGANGLSAKHGPEGEGSEGFVVIAMRAGTVTSVKVILSRFKDVTDDVYRLLNYPPASRRKFRLAGEVNPDTGTKYPKKGWYWEFNSAEVNGLPKIWSKWPPDDWALDDLALAHFIDPQYPLTSGALNFSRAALNINMRSVVLQLAGVDAPQLFAVAWPDTVVRDASLKPAAFLIFLEQTLSGNFYDAMGQFVGESLPAYPNNFDYAYMLYQQLHYSGISTVADTWTMPPTPFPNPAMKGVPYQVAKAGKNVVTVVPLVSFDKNYGVMDDAEKTKGILADLQAFMFYNRGIATPPTTVGKTAIAAFSNATHVLYQWIKNADKGPGKFFGDTVRAVYFLDPPRDTKPEHVDYDVNTYIGAAKAWADAGTDRRIRLYMRDHSDAHGLLLGKTPPSVPYVQNSDDGLRTAAELPTAIWLAALSKAGLKLTLKNTASTKEKVEAQFQFAHHMFAATMLTHALWQKDLD